MWLACRSLGVHPYVAWIYSTLYCRNFSSLVGDIIVHKGEQQWNFERDRKWGDDWERDKNKVRSRFKLNKPKSLNLVERREIKENSVLQLGWIYFFILFIVRHYHCLKIIQITHKRSSNRSMNVNCVRTYALVIM